MLYNKPGSGTYATDTYRDERALAAAHALSGGHSVFCKSGDHKSASETCVEVIARCGNDPLKSGGGNGVEHNAVWAAVEKLRQGYGHHKAQADHAGGNTCAQVVAAATV